MLLVGAGRHAQGWLEAHPPLEQRVRRIYGRPMPSLAAGADRGGRPT